MIFFFFKYFYTLYINFCYIMVDVLIYSSYVYVIYINEVLIRFSGTY